MLEPELIYADLDLIVVNKPAGMPAHEAKHATDATLVDWLLERFPEIKDVGDIRPADAIPVANAVEPPVVSRVEPYRPGIVHRLDKLTSGVMVIARNQESFLRLKELFQKRQVEKTYCALVCGDIKVARGVIEEQLGRLKSSPTKVGVQGARGGGIKNPKEAVTEYTVRERFTPLETAPALAPLEVPASAGQSSLNDLPLTGLARPEGLWGGLSLTGFTGATLLEVLPKTGRMHQIRVHLASIGHPVAGDTIYGGKNVCFKELGRYFLHAATLSFAFREGQALSFSAELPPELQNLLDKLRGQRLAASV
ncbi:MAG: RNA pseudouridine synthase [bacterium]|nr:RNA pseudouridine synthase [bacterium]